MPVRTQLLTRRDPGSRSLRPEDVEDTYWRCHGSPAAGVCCVRSPHVWYVMDVSVLSVDRQAGSGCWER